MENLPSLLFTLYFALCGILIARLLFTQEKPLPRLWLGLVLGLLGLSWLPSLFAFLFGFTLLSTLLGAGLMGLLACLSLYKFRKQPLLVPVQKKELLPLVCLLPLLLIGVYLFHTHILQPKNGGYYVGQTTYGDLSMHLSFISSLATQGRFPPEYSIFPGHAVNYPFLCETGAGSLLLLGASLRAAYLISALYGYVLVLLGVYFLLKSWLKTPKRALLGSYLFFLGGGFGFLAFIDRLNGSSTLSALLQDGSFSTNLSWILDGYYRTPTNLPEIGLRWVNPIVDMLIPQRATLMGWAFLFPCIYLLLSFRFEKKKEALPGLILLASGLPLIHTHSFLALGLLSAVYCLQELISSFDKKRLLCWLLYGGTVMLLAAPQLFGFAFQQAGESGMVRLHFNWANEVDGFLWFYIKNLGWIFLSLLPGLLLLSKKDRQIMLAPLILWLVAELVVFQPNIYDNNKLLFVWFLYLCGLSAKLMAVLSHRLQLYIEKKTSPDQRKRSLSLGMLLCLLFVLFFTLTGIEKDMSLRFPQSGLMSVLAVLGLYLLLSFTRARQSTGLPALCCGCIGLLMSGYLLHTLIQKAASAMLSLSAPLSLLCLGVGILLLGGTLYQYLQDRLSAPLWGAAGLYLTRQLLCYLLCVTLFLSGSLTVLRECRSSYQAFGKEELQAADYVKENTDPDALFLTDYNWHLNPISALTGRSIVCGPDLYLYYHGIDTHQRHEDIAAMLEAPAQNETLFKQYGVEYVYIGSSERGNFACDTDWFHQNGALVYQQNGISIYRLNIQ